MASNLGIVVAVAIVYTFCLGRQAREESMCGEEREEEEIQEILDPSHITAASVEYQA